MVEQTNGSHFALCASSIESDVPCPESAANPASGDGSGCDPREQTGRGSPAGRGGSRWQPKTRCGVFVPREHNLAPFGFWTRESAARSTSEVERGRIPGSQSRQRRGAPVPANGRRFMSRQEWGACSFGPERIGACCRPTGDGGQPMEGDQLFIGEPRKG